MSRELVSINGATGSGKSTKLRGLVGGFSHVVAICKHAREERIAWARFAFRCVDDLPDMTIALAQHWRGGFRLAIFPRLEHQALCVDRVAHLVWRYSERHRLARLVFVVDELAFCFSNALSMRNDLTGFKQLVLDGRHFNVSMYCGSQRPQDVAALWRDECQTKYFFRLQGRARDAVIEDIGRDHARSLPTENFEFLEWRSGRITKGRTSR